MSWWGDGVRGVRERVCVCFLVCYCVFFPKKIERGGVGGGGGRRER